jgi:hypothetical protein
MLLRIRRAVPLALLTILTTAAPAVAAPAPSKPPAAATYRLVADTGQLSATQRTTLDKHRKPYASKTVRSSLPRSSQAEDDLRTACQQQRPAAATAPRGWLRDRFQQCYAKRLQYIVVRNDNGTPAGEITFEFWLLGFGNHGIRQVDYLISVEDITVSTVPGNVIDWPNQMIELMMRGCSVTADTTCAHGVAKTVDQWFNVPSYAVTYTSAPSTGTGADFVWYNRVTHDLRIGTSPIRPTTQPDIVETYIRFDTGRKMVRAHGAVFPDYTPELVLSLSDPAVNESALHIRDAQDFPTRTFPSWLGKTVPGKPGGEPLHRTVDDARSTANNTAAINTCKQVWGPDYATGGMQCDEYPFKVTQEGAANAINGTPTRRYSARPITGTDNGNAGNRLGELYGGSRVLDGEQFYVRITA